MTEREPISKRLRFEVFKRDGFICQYCGSHPPEIILHIDHVRPVATGGRSDIDNLVTACLECNSGKGAIELTVVPQSMADKALETQEREAQIRGYEAILTARRERIEEEMWQIADALVPGSPEDGLNRAWLQKIRECLGKLGFDDTLDSARIANARFRYGNAKTFAYFCGICNRKIYNDDRGGRFTQR